MVPSVGIAQLLTLAVHQNGAVVSTKDEPFAVRLDAFDVKAFARTFLKHLFVFTILEDKNLALISTNQKLSSGHPNVAGVVLTDLGLFLANGTVNDLHLVISDPHVLETAETSDQELVMVSVVERHLHGVECRGCTTDLLLIVKANAIPSPDDNLDVGFACEGTDELLLEKWCKRNRQELLRLVVMRGDDTPPLHSGQVPNAANSSLSLFAHGKVLLAGTHGQGSYAFRALDTWDVLLRFVVHVVDHNVVTARVQNALIVIQEETIVAHITFDTEHKSRCQRNVLSSFSLAHESS